jgi:hypothetical protein
VETESPVDDFTRFSVSGCVTSCALSVATVPEYSVLGSSTSGAAVAPLHPSRWSGTRYCISAREPRPPHRTLHHSRTPSDRSWTTRHDEDAVCAGVRGGYAEA